MPVSGLFIGISDAKGQGLLEGLGVNHQADGQSPARKSAGYGHGAEIEDIAVPGDIG